MVFPPTNMSQQGYWVAGIFVINQCSRLAAGRNRNPEQCHVGVVHGGLPIFRAA
jgi:hypothetical protein